jgi:hypothetical protein
MSKAPRLFDARSRSSCLTDRVFFADAARRGADRPAARTGLSRRHARGHRPCRARARHRGNGVRASDAHHSGRPQRIRRDRRWAGLALRRRIQIAIVPGSRLAALYGSATGADERTTCNYGLAPELQDLASQHGMRVSATDNTGEVRAVERTDHPFFFGTLFQPQLRSTPTAPYPVFTGLLQAAVAR